MRLFLWIALVAAIAFADTKKFMVDLKTGDMDTFSDQLLVGVPGTIDYFTAQGDRVEVAVVIHGDAYKYFVQNLDNTQYGMDKKLADNQEAIHKRLAEIEKKYGIRFEVCMAGMHKKGILSEDLYPFVTPIKSAMVGLVKWQNAGYAYVPAHDK